MTLIHPTTDQLSFEVPGMHCAGCVHSITREVSSIAGVADVDVALEQHRVTVRGEELAEQVVREAILLAGYDSRLLG